METGKSNIPASPQLDGALLLAQLRELGEIGADAQAGGRTRIALSDDEKAGRDLVVKWMRESGLDVQVGFVNADFGEGRKTIRASKRLALVITRAAAICSVTGL